MYVVFIQKYSALLCIFKDYYSEKQFATLETASGTYFIKMQKPHKKIQKKQHHNIILHVDMLHA
jgi:hypothetical protein